MPFASALPGLRLCANMKLYNVSQEGLKEVMDMGMFLNSIAPYEKYRAISCSRYFVDKSLLLEELIEGMGAEPQYICVTRPRRFGKTVMANMIGAFFGQAVSSGNIFERLKISASGQYSQHCNKHDIIYIDFSKIPEACSSYGEYIARFSDGLKADLVQFCPALKLDKNKAVWDLFNEVFYRNGRRKFIFILDEWDAIFHMSFASDNDKKSYLLFLKNLLKDQEYVEMVYMTGILPIAKYSDGSELNMFVEYSMPSQIRFSEYFGFTEQEVDTLYERYKNVIKFPRITRDELRQWYDGYYTAAGKRMYNPRSVVCALTNNQLDNYWTSSGTYDSVFYYVKNNIDDVRNDIALLVAGEPIPATIQEYAATSMELKTKEEIYSAMVVYGLLTYQDGCVSIPNKELMLSFETMIKRENSLGYIHRLADGSSRMLAATLAGDTKTMADILQYAHDTETPVLSYNNETELAALVNLVYLSARDRYRVEREDKAGKGFVDFIFYPKRPYEDCLILELKVDVSPKEAVAQIKDKQYMLRFKGKLGEAPFYTGRILAVGISYNKSSKEHSCQVEIL